MARPSKLNDDQVIEIYNLMANGGNAGEIAKAFGISKTGVAHITLGATHKHLNLPRLVRRTFLGGSWKSSVEDRVAASFTIDPETGCHNWNRAKTSKGYGAIVVNRRTLPAHRVSYELANGTISDESFVLHNCDNPSCINPAHLRLGTHDENMHDKVLRSRVPAGENHYNSKITADQAVEIMKLFGEGKTADQVSSITGINKGTINNVKYGGCWNDVTGVPRKKLKSRSKYLNAEK